MLFPITDDILNCLGSCFQAFLWLTLYQIPKHGLALLLLYNWWTGPIPLGGAFCNAAFGEPSVSRGKGQDVEAFKVVHKLTKFNPSILILEQLLILGHKNSNATSVLSEKKRRPKVYLARFSPSQGFICSA